MRKIFVLIAVIAAAFYLAYIAHVVSTDSTKDDKTLQTSTVSVDETADNAISVFEPESEYLYSFISYKSQHILNIDAILQMPDYPTGCEIVSLAMALQYITGKTVSIDTLIDDYLLTNDHDFITGFMGDPRRIDGGGCFPPVIVACANKFFADNHLNLTAADASGITLDTLCETIDAGFPVLMWTTMYLEEPQLTSHIIEDGAKTYQWYISEHCVLVKGYDTDKNVLVVNDPLAGETEYDTETFMNISDSIGNLAVILQ